MPMRKLLLPRSFFAIAAALLPGGVTGASLVDPESIDPESVAPDSGGELESSPRVSAPEAELSSGVSPPSAVTAGSSLPLQEIRARANKERNARRIERTRRADRVPVRRGGGARLRRRGP